MDEFQAKSGPVEQITLVLPEPFGIMTVWSANIDGLAIFEGNIVLGKVDDLKAPLPAEAESPNDGGPIRHVLHLGDQVQGSQCLSLGSDFTDLGNPSITCP